jgi:TPR repeat protein
VDLDVEQAVILARKSAEQGNAQAEFRLGWCYSRGRGVERNDKLAIEWYRKAAQHGSVEAIQALKNLGAAPMP